MKKAILFALLTLTTSYAETLDENITAIEEASAAIDIAIKAKRGTTTGGLKNAAQAILKIPDNIEPFSNEYAVVETKYTTIIITNMVDCQYVDYMQFIGGYYFNTKIVPTSNTTIECEISVESLKYSQCVFGSSMEDNTSQFQLVSMSENTSNYTELEYIQSDGNQWLDTGITDYRNETFMIDIDLLGHSIMYQCIMGAGETHRSSDALFTAVVHDSGQNIWLYSGTHANIWSANYSEGDRYAITLCCNRCDVENKTKGITSFGTSDTTSLTLGNRSFCILRGDSSDANLCQTGLKARIYSFKSNNMDMIPVKDHNDVVCMYDKIGKTFFYNKGTGNFIAGPVKGKYLFNYKIDNDIGSNSYVHDNSRYLIRASGKNCNVYSNSTELVAELVSTGLVVDCKNPLGLFCCFNGQSCIPTNMMSNVKFYQFKVYENDNLTCHLIPVQLKDSDGNYTIPKFINAANNMIFNDPVIPEQGNIISGNQTNQTTAIYNIITNVTSEFVAYTTNIVGAAENKIIIDDAANQIYNDILK